MKPFAHLLFSMFASLGLSVLASCNSDPAPTEEARAAQNKAYRDELIKQSEQMLAAEKALEAAQPYAGVDAKKISRAERKKLCGEEFGKVWIGMSEQAFLVCNGPIKLVAASANSQTYQRCVDYSCATAMIVDGELASWNAP